MSALTSFESDQPFAALIPRGLREQASGMSWSAFTTTYCRTGGPIRLGSWTSTTGRGGRTVFDATFGINPVGIATAGTGTPSDSKAATIFAAQATSYGPIDALTSMLYDAGFHIEIVSFHQQRLSELETATFVLCEHDGRQEWSMALGHGSAESSIRAIISAANMLHR
jgi:hypothetical protein